MADHPLVELKEVSKSFQAGGTEVRAVTGVSLDVGYGTTLGVIGESGSGKSTVTRLVLGLHRPDAGSVHFDGVAVNELRPDELQKLRARIGMVFQEPQESLNPRIPVGRAVAEPLRVHRAGMSRGERRALVVDALAHVALGETYLKRYPGQLSGGQQQRVAIARAIVLRPKLLVLDEPTSALDLSVQAQILRLLERLREELGLAYLFVSHDIDCVAHSTERIAVMFRGRVVEVGPTGAVLDDPRHPYSRRLLSARLSPTPKEQADDHVAVLGEAVDALSDLPAGSAEAGPTERVELYEVGPGHFVAPSTADVDAD